MPKPKSTETAATRFSLDQTTYRGRVSDLMRPGAAKPFLQPWYTPISCTPMDTGMPMGGLGSAFTLTPAGTTPARSLLNGVHVTPPEGAPVRLRNLFFAEREADAALEVADPGRLLGMNRYQALRRGNGQPWLTGKETPEQLKIAIAAMAAHAGLYAENEAALERWHVALSPRTAACLAKGASPELSRALLLDVFGSALRLKPLFSSSLTGDVERVAGADGKGAAVRLAGQDPYPAASMEYAGLYPVCETVHAGGAHALGLRVRSFSPVICGDERACSLPVSVTEVILENPTSRPLEATLAWTLENLVGDQVIKARPGVQDAWFHLVRTATRQRGEVLREHMDGSQSHGQGGQSGPGARIALGVRLFREGEGADADFSGSMAMAMDCDAAEGAFYASAHPSFYASDEEKIVAEALGTGRITPWHEDVLPSGRERRMGALCATVVVPPGGTCTVAFALVLDFPGIRMQGFASRKKYATWFPDPDRRAPAIAFETLARREDYRQRIAADHAAVEGLGGIPELLAKAPSDDARARFKTMLANNLGFLADATVWDEEDRFWVRECADYPFFNSLDVYFYGSFAVLRLLPRLDGSVLKEFAQAVLAGDPAPRRFWEYSHHPYADLPDPRHEGPRSVPGAVPHDMGSPFDPAPDAYIWHNVKHWKDLAPKFLLLVLRQYRLTGDRAFLETCREAVFAALKYLSGMRGPGETIPLTHGTDDTFDNLASHGVSIYCGSLWVAALYAGAAIAEETGHAGEAKEWRALGERARRDLAQNLWDEEGGYYRFYRIPETGEVCEDVFADQLLADLWMSLLGLPEITPAQRRARAVGMVLKTNFRKNSPGIGAANLCKRDGGALDSFQAQDIWLGVQYSLAAAATRAGDFQGAWELIEAQYDNLYRKARIPFGAPEGFNATVSATALQYTAGRYLRPGMAWVFAWPATPSRDLGTQIPLGVVS
jgi:uncharacterized protein (DUF608 family)